MLVVLSSMSKLISLITDLKFKYLFPKITKAERLKNKFKNTLNF